MGKHAYLIMAYDRWTQLADLMGLLDDSRNDIFLHVNARSGNVPFERLEKSVHKSSFFKLERYPIYWGDYSITNCIIQSLKKILKTDRYDYIHLLSGLDLPIKSQNYIHNFFDLHEGQNFINSYPYGKLPIEWYRRVSFYNIGTKYFRNDNWIVRKSSRGLDKVARKVQELLHIDRVKKICKDESVKIMGGATWFSITSELASVIVEQERLIQKIFEKDTIFADELFVQTIAWSFGFEKTIFDSSKIYKEGNGSLRLIDWQRGDPYVWREKDFNEILQSNCLFARKFDERIDKTVIELIIQTISKANKENIL